MPIPSGYSRNTIAGTLPNGEIFATSFWCNEGPTTLDATQTQADTLGQLFGTEWNSGAGSPAGLVPAACTVDSFTTYSYLDNSGKASFVGVHTLALVGVANSQSMPDQCALVTTLNTGASGRRHRGRMYWPALYGLTGNGQMGPALCDGLSQWLATYFGGVNSHLGDQRVVVLSQAAGNSRAVTAIKVDSVVDTQRRRAQSQSASHSISTAIAG